MADTFEVIGLKEFEARVKNFAEKLPEELIVPFTKKIALQALRGVVIKTRVDTGRARGAWITTLGAGTNSTPEAPKSGERKSSARAGAAGRQAIGQGTAAVRGLQPFVPVFISNNVEYIQFLENGGPNNEPDLMVALTLQEIRSQF